MEYLELQNPYFPYLIIKGKPIDKNEVSLKEMEEKKNTRKNLPHKINVEPKNCK